MSRRQFPHILYWLMIIGGGLSFTVPTFKEYGIIYTVILTFLCGLFSLAFAILLHKREYICISALLLLSPYLFLLVKYLTPI